MAKVPHLTRLWGQWYFRRVIPADLRQIIGQREIKHPVGHNYAQAVAGLRLHGVESDLLFEQARRKLDRITRTTATDDEIRRWVLVWFHEAERRAFEEIARELDRA